MKIPITASVGASVSSVGIFNVYWVTSKQTRGAPTGGVLTQ
ncbi:MAG TPA: hypothetical protein VI934_04145 [Candidatus Nanoarchaeia archaeon]|nr:hypothetical protein [Candidatus Nanoarchaeia archaeon]